MKVKMKPETMERRARERAAEREARRAELIRRTRENAERDGPGSFWAMMLEDLLA
jgi:hypothetical protein